VSTSGLVVRRERPAHHAAVREVHRAAFAAATPAGEHFQARVLTGGAVPGRFRYAEPFDRL
jgi:hypothetical protein